MERKARYLVDTNIWLERLLDQEKSNVVAKFLDLTPPSQLFVSDFSLHSIGVILSRYKKYELLEKFIDDLFINSQIRLLSLDVIDLFDVTANIKKYGLDFDDSYQFTTAQKYDMTIITFDKDFNISGIRKNSPEEIIDRN